MGLAEANTFGRLLKRHRRQMNFTQEELAECAHISVYTISNLERGVPHRPHQDTLILLAEALDLSPEDRGIFLAAYRQRTGKRELQSSSTELITPDLPVQRLHNIPFPPTALIGREKELTQAVAYFLDQQVRLLTLIGPGGSGKTHLSLEVARALSSEYKDGVFFVSLGSLQDAHLVANTIAQTLEIKEDPTKPIQRTLVTQLQDKHLLLLLDNFEHLIIAAPIIAELLAHCPKLNVLVTSRTAVHIRGEQQMPVLPLSVPDMEHLPPLEELALIPAIMLFLQRAHAVVPQFTLTQTNAQVIAALCCRLDGLPLAIELAAARIQVLTPETLLEHLNHRQLDVLTDGPYDLPERQQTLRATLSWSYQLLTSNEQMLFRRLGVFVGGCSVEATEALRVTKTKRVLDHLATLVNMQLVRRDIDATDQSRFTMLETVHAYALECLKKAQEFAAMQQAHAHYYQTWAATIEFELQGPNGAIWFNRLEQEHDNFRRALRWSIENASAPYKHNGNEEHSEEQSSICLEVGLRLAAAIWRFWAARGYVKEGREWLERLLAIDAELGYKASPLVRAQALISVGVLVYQQGMYKEARCFYEESLALRRAANDTNDGIAKVLSNLGILEQEQGNYAEAQRLYEESLALRRARSSSKHGLAAALNGLAIVLRLQGNYARAQVLQEERLAIKREIGDAEGIAISLNNLGILAYEQQNYEYAQRLFSESLELASSLNNQRQLAQAQRNLAEIACKRGAYTRAVTLTRATLQIYEDSRNIPGKAEALEFLGFIAFQRHRYTEATRYFQQAIVLFASNQIQRHVATCLEALANVLCAKKRLPLTIRLLSAATTLRTTINLPPAPSEQAIITSMLSQAHEALDEQQFRSAWQQGQQLTQEQAVAEALDI